MAQQPGRRLAPVFNVAEQYRLQPFRFGKVLSA
jgi:hypothetical protein